MVPHYLEKDMRERIANDPEIFRSLEAATLDGLWYLDLENPAKQWYSPRFKALFGYDPHEIKNTSNWWQNNIHPDDLVPTTELLRRHIEDPTVPYNCAVRYRHRDGRYIWVRCRGFTILDENKRAIRIMGAITSIHAQKTAEITLARQNSEMNRTNYIMSHDMRKPIRHMVGFAEAFVEDHENLEGLTENGKRQLEKIRKAGHKAEGLLDGITMFARLGAVDTWGDFHLSLSWEDAVDDYRTDIEKVNAVVEIAGSLPYVAGSSSMIYQVLGNLLGNALKFTRPDVQPRITIRAWQHAARVIVEVEDNGVGIPLNMRSEAFLLFRRVGPQAQTTQGMGLGLAVVSRIVNAHNGTIEANESPSGGTIIRFDLPLAGYRR